MSEEEKKEAAEGSGDALQEMKKEREQYFEDDGLIGDLIRANTEAVKGISDYIYNVHHPLKWGFNHRRKSFNSIMLGVIAIAVVYIAFNI
jgi:hypothetical protein